MTAMEHPGIEKPHSRGAPSRWIRDHPDWVLLLGMAVLCVVLLADYFFSGSHMVPGLPTEDGRTNWLPWRVFAGRHLRNGVVPLWNPHVLCGTPFLANFQSAALYPPNAIYAFLPIHLAINVSLALHLFLSLAFTYALGRRMRLSREASLLSGLAFALCAPQFLRIHQGNWGAVCALPWIPLIFFSAEGVINAEGEAVGKRISSGTLGALALGMQLFSGAPQTVLYTLLALGIYSICRILGERERRRSARFWGVTIGLLGGAVAVGFALAAAQVLPGFAVLGELTRAGQLKAGWSDTFALPAENLATLLMPRFFGDGVGLLYWGQYNFWEMCLYVGVLSLPLARADALRGILLLAAGAAVIALGLRRRLGRRAAAALLVAILAIDMASFGRRYVGPESCFDPHLRESPFGAADLMPWWQRPERVFIYDWLPMNDAMILGCRTVEGIEPNPPRRFHELFCTTQKNKLIDIAPSFYQILRFAPALRAMGLRMVAVEPGRNKALPKLPVLFRGRTCWIVENRAAQPRAYFASRFAVARDAEQALEYTAKLKGDPVVILEEEPGKPMAGEFLRRPLADRIEINADAEMQSPNALLIQATLTQPGFLVLADNYLTGWRATTNGRPVKIYRANYAFRALYLGAGEHGVEFRYRPAAYVAGVWVSLAAWLGLLAYIAWLAWGRLAPRIRKRQVAGSDTDFPLPSA